MAAGALKQENAFLKLGNIKGKAETKGFQDQIVFQSMSYSVHQAGEWEDGDRLSGRITTFGDLTIVKDMDSSSPSLAQACATKEQFPKAEISLVAAGKETYLKVTLENVIVTSIAIGFHSGEPRPSETVTLSYKKATWEWGTAKAGYDLKQNAKV
jgi:type VI secretion system secreted protein Hcp